MINNISIPPESGIYKLLIGNFVYYGRSKNIRNRCLEHLRMLNKNKHHNIRLQRAFNKYKKFSCELIEIVNDPELIKIREGYWISTTKNVNVADGDFGSDTITNHPDRIKILKKLSLAQKHSWDQEHLSDNRKNDLIRRTSFDYKLNHSGNTFKIHTPFGEFPSYTDCIRKLKLGDLNSLKSWLNGKEVNQQMVNACKSKMFTQNQIGLNTNQIGWYYVPI